MELMDRTPSLHPDPPPWPWEQLTQALTHVLTHPTPTPSLHSQLLFSTLTTLRHDHYPPLFSPLPFLWSLSLFLRRLRRRDLSSWRSKCPYQHPPPLVLSAAVGPADWIPEGRRAHFRRRLGLVVPTPLAIVAPNALLLLLLFWNPLWMRQGCGCDLVLPHNIIDMVSHCGRGEMLQQCCVKDELE